MSGPPQRHPLSVQSAEAVGAEQLRELLATDRIATLLAAATLVILSVITSADRWILGLAAMIAAMGLVRQIGEIPLRAGRTENAVRWFAIGSWGVAIGAVLIAPLALPIVVVTMAVPTILAAMYLRDREVRLMTAGLVIAAAITGAIARWTDGVGIEDDIDPNLVSLGVVCFLAAQMVPMIMAVRQASWQYRTALGEALLANMASQVAQEEAVLSRARLAQAADVERRNIERDLHDGSQQQLVSALVQLRVFDETIKRGREPKPGTVTNIANDLEAAIDELRALARGIYPSLLQTRGLLEALHGLARVGSVPAAVRGKAADGLPGEVETALYFIASEALQNAAKHAGPDATATIDLSTRDGVFYLQVSDDGTGLIDAASYQSRGMINMQDRVAAVGGRLTVTGQAGEGCTITAAVPLDTEVGALSI